MRVLLYSIEVPIAEDPTAVMVPCEEVGGTNALEVVNEMKRAAGQSGGLVEYIGRTRTFLDEMHDIRLRPAEGADDEALAQSFLELLVEQGLAEIVEA